MNEKPSQSREVLKAIQFAAEKHRHQRRKDEESSPYVNHPIAVANTLVSVGGLSDLHLIQAALLHDTIEDTETTADELEHHFGSEVRNLVLEVTDDKNLPKQERKRLQVEHTKYISDRAKQIKLADKISNIVDITHSPPAKWSAERKLEYLSWSEQVVAGCRGVNSSLEKRFDEVVAEGRERIGK